MTVQTSNLPITVQYANLAIYWKIRLFLLEFLMKIKQEREYGRHAMFECV